MAHSSRTLTAGLFENARRSGAAVSAGWLLALLTHAAGAAWMIERPRAASLRTPPPVELEFIAPPPPAPEPEHVPEPPPPEAPAPKAPVNVTRAAPAAARAGALHTAAPQTPAAQTDDTLDFTTDPNGTTYGGGVVAVGGTAAFGATGAKADGRVNAPPVHSAVPAGPSLTALADLSRKPGLRADPCHGFFPAQAIDDSGDVGVLVTVASDGHVLNTTLVSESPRGQGFGAAARNCLQRERLSPALDRAGKPAATAIRINLSFRR